MKRHTTGGIINFKREQIKRFYFCEFSLCQERINLIEEILDISREILNQRDVSYLRVLKQLLIERLDALKQSSDQCCSLP